MEVCVLLYFSAERGKEQFLLLVEYNAFSCCLISIPNITLFWQRWTLVLWLLSGVRDENDHAYNPKIVRIGLKPHHSVRAVSMDYLVCGNN